MKKGFCLLACVGLSFNVVAQHYPPEWVKYTSGGYMFVMESDSNRGDQPEGEFKNDLLNTARANLARQVRMKVHDFAELKKHATNGSTVVDYSSRTQFSTDVDLRLVETRSHYDPATKEGYAIAYVDKDAACRYYRNEITLFLGKADNARTTALSYIGTGFGNRARTELESVLPQFQALDESLFWLNLYGSSQNESERLLQQRNASEQSIKRLLAELQYGTSVCLTCSTDIFGNEDTALQDALKGALAAEGCNFTDDPARAGWIIRVGVAARAYRRLTVDAQPLYFAYADAQISIDKATTSQRICEEGLSVKGGHTLSYEEAARTACKDLSKQLGSLILNAMQR